MRPDDFGPSRPTLPAEAGPTERTLYEVYDVQTGIVDLTAADWRTTAESVRGLSAEVRGIVSALRGAPDAWTGPAAEAAYATLGKLAENLDVHAEDIDRIEAGLTSAYDSVTTARADYVNRVRTHSLDVDPADYQRRDPAAPPQLPLEDAKVLDRQAYDSAVAEAKAAREQEAAAVLATFTDSMTTATKKLPVDPVEQTPVSAGSTSGGGGGGGTGGGGTGPSGTTYHPPSGTTGVWVSQPTDGGDGTTPPTDTTDTGDDGDRGDDTETGTWPPPVTGPPPVLDGPVDGGLTPVGPGGPGPVPGSTGAPAPVGGVGPGGAAAGMGGMLAGGGAAALLGRGGMPGAAGGRLPAAFGGGGGTAGRPGGPAAGSGRPSVLTGGGQGGAGRGGGGGRGGTGGARTGRYGVPKLGERAAGRSAVAGGGAGGRGQKGDHDEAVDVDHLTTEDEETWFEGADDATPPVWD